MTEAAKERAAVVAWLRKMAARHEYALGVWTDAGNASRAMGAERSIAAYAQAADAVERGEHMGPRP